MGAGGGRDLRPGEGHRPLGRGGGGAAPVQSYGGAGGYNLVGAGVGDGPISFLQVQGVGGGGAVVAADGDGYGVSALGGGVNLEAGGDGVGVGGGDHHIGAGVLRVVHRHLVDRRGVRGLIGTRAK